jgi:glycosyltransferase
MKISIITAAYNSELTIGDTLGCIRDQDHSSVEHIIIDGGSTDDTLRIVSRYPHVAQIISERDRGIYDAMNKGILRATGEVVGILNSDDIYTGTDTLSMIAEAFSNPAVQAVYADLQYVLAADPGKIVRTWKAGKFSRNNFYYGWMPPHPTFFVRRKIYDELGLFNLDLRSAADYELMLRILLKHKIPALYIPRVIVKMRTGGMSNASFKNRLRANREDQLAWKLNGLNPHFFTVYIKPIRKITQFLIR